MHYSLGIDAGGTYTDAVIIRNSDSKIIDSNKALTTYPDLLAGIESAIDGLDSVYLPEVRLVSVSTTLATNTILEQTGYPVALILVGERVLPENIDIEEYTVVKGGHNINGNENESLDLDSVREYVTGVRDRVSAFAVSSYFSVRNPDHELRVKEVIKEMTDLPVVCGHELSQDLGAYERGVTAYLNAQLIPIAKKFIDAIVSDIRRRGIDASVMMLKCDGSVVGIQEAMDRPIESVFSGPAASLMGASFLSKNDTCAVIDVGGTSTDVSLNIDGFPELVDTGAVVGGWHTKVKAIRMETSAMGGDSHVWIRNRKINVGPRRVMPLCLAAVKYPVFMEQLRSSRVPSAVQLDENIQPTKFFVRTSEERPALCGYEGKILAMMGKEPVSINDIFRELGHPVSATHLDSLVQKRLVQTIGFTPTDALHVLGEYSQWDSAASLEGARILARLTSMNEYELCSSIKKELAVNMAVNLMAFMFRDVERSEIEKMIRGNYFSQLRSGVPVVLLGGPVCAYKNELDKLIDARITVPEHAEVGNAVGALTGKGVKRIRILVRPSYKEGERSSTVFSPVGSAVLPSHEKAVEYATGLGRRLVMEYMEGSGVEYADIDIDVRRQDVTMDDNGGMPIETRMFFMGTGIPKSADPAGERSG